MSGSSVSSRSSKSSKSGIYKIYLKVVENYESQIKKSLELQEKWKDLAIQNVLKPSIVEDEEVDEAFLFWKKSQEDLYKIKNEVIKYFKLWKEDERRINHSLLIIEDILKNSDKKIKELNDSLEDYLPKENENY
jgi:hypothetical protein